MYSRGDLYQLGDNFLLNQHIEIWTKSKQVGISNEIIKFQLHGKCRKSKVDIARDRVFMNWRIYLTIRNIW